MPQTLYSIRTDIDKDGQDGYRITKFVDGEVESSYLTNRNACECPAGVRPTCRHRQMIPHMLNADIQNTHWFMTWPEAEVVDFQGQSRQILAYLTGAEGVEATVAVTTDLTTAAVPDPTDLRQAAQADAWQDLEANLPPAQPAPNAFRRRI